MESLLLTKMLHKTQKYLKKIITITQYLYVNVYFSIVYHYKFINVYNYNYLFYLEILGTAIHKGKVKLEILVNRFLTFYFFKLFVIMN